jgi:hypothetical protein
VLVTEFQERGHEQLALPGNAPASGSGDFGDEAVKVKTLEQVRNSGAMAVPGVRMRVVALIHIKPASPVRTLDFFVCR